MDPAKDVDGLHPLNVGLMVRGEPAFPPATPYGIVELLLRTGISLDGAEVCVVGYGELVGAPLSIMLAHSIRGNATVTITHVRTKDLGEHKRGHPGRGGGARDDHRRHGEAGRDGPRRRGAPNGARHGRRRGSRRVSQVAGAITPVPGAWADDGGHAHGEHRDGRRARDLPALSRSPSRLARVLSRGQFAVTAEVVAPRSADPATVEAHGRALVGYADAVNVTDNPRASAHMSAIAGAGLLAGLGLEPILQTTTRDRNRLALTSDLLGAWALGARSILCLSGDCSRSVTTQAPPRCATCPCSTSSRSRRGCVTRDGRSRASRSTLRLATSSGWPTRRVAEYDPGRLEAKLDAGADSCRRRSPTISMRCARGRRSSARAASSTARR